MFPRSSTVQWAANSPADQVIDYSVRVNGTLIGTTTQTQFPYTFTEAGTYTFEVRARNAWGVGSPGAATVVAGVPGQVQTVTIVF